MKSATFRIIVPFRKSFFRLIERVTNDTLLLLYQLLNTGLVDMKLLIFSSRYRTGDDQGGTGIINQYRVHLIHHGVMVFPLHHFFGGVHHVVTEVVKTKFVVRAICNIGEIGFSSFFTVGLVFVDTVNSNAQPFENGAIPFLVTTGQVIIHRNYMHPFAGKRIEVRGQGGYEGFTFTRCHLRDLTLVQHNTTDQLYIIVYHVPGHLATGGRPGIFENGFISINGYIVFFYTQVTVHIGGRGNEFSIFFKTAGRFLHYGKSFG